MPSQVFFAVYCAGLVARIVVSVEAVWEAPAGPEGWTGERIQEAFSIANITNKQILEGSTGKKIQEVY